MDQPRKRNTQVHPGIQGRDRRADSKHRPFCGRNCRDLGTNEVNLGNWVNNAKAGEQSGDKPLDTEERVRLKELEEEVRWLRLERELLQKTAAWLAREN